MIDHVSFFVTDIAASKAFYDAALRPLGIEAVLETDQNGKHWVAYAYRAGALAGQPQFWLGGPAPVGNHLHWSFAAPSRAEVDAFYTAALAAGGRDNGKPGDRHPGYYASFVLDPDGHNVEVTFRS